MPLSPMKRTPLSHRGIALLGPDLAASARPVPGERHRRACRRGRRRCTCALIDAGAISGCGGGPLASIVSGASQLERPERQVVPVAAQVGHGAVAEVPPAIPLRPGEIDVVEGPLRRGAQPESQSSPGGHRIRLRRTLLHADDVVVRFGVLLDSAIPRRAPPRRATSRTAPIAPDRISSTTRR